MYYIYVLVSCCGRRTYVGYTKDLAKRLEVPNQGFVKSSKAFRPFRILFIEECKTKGEARKRELYHKSRTGRRRLKEYMSKLRPSKC